MDSRKEARIVGLSIAAIYVIFIALAAIGAT